MKRLGKQNGLDQWFPNLTEGWNQSQSSSSGRGEPQARPKNSEWALLGLGPRQPAF